MEIKNRGIINLKSSEFQYKHSKKESSFDPFPKFAIVLITKLIV